MLRPQPMLFRKVEIKFENWEEEEKEKPKVRLVTNVKRVQLS
ncbi:hypothetical protein [Pyrococcus kukulkanii]|uniref:Transposase n=1 Tax=Pyrococcus kukulkanii TaxID=1609559 RepID=A0ABV4T4Q2_9EURY